MTRHLIPALGALWLAAILAQTLQAAPAQAPAQTHGILAAKGVSFQTSDNCLACHNGLVSPSGEDVSIGVSWRASMMANSARDPYWQAAVRRETLDHPSQRAAIEHECSRCHMPMTAATAAAAGRDSEVFRLLGPDDGSEEHRLAADGVSCTLCHQIGADRLGTKDSFVGGFAIAAPAAGARPQMAGPYEIDRGRVALMRSATDVEPAQARHLRESELCATCHTLYTDALGPDGKVVGSLPEQVPYLEWRHSAFREERSCQDCHMPASADTPIASVLGEPRERLARHTFLGGNFFMLRMLNRNRDLLSVVAPPRELEAAAQATLRQLAEDTAAVTIDGAQTAAGRLTVDVSVRNMTGHKLPTGYPSRRVWLHVVVVDARGRPVFESGALTARGDIVGNDNDADPLAVEPHHATIQRGEDVQIYEAVMADPAGRVTTGLLQATSYVKDNRLLPRGFVKATADRDIAVVGGAASDADFTGDGDRVRYSMALGAATGPFRIEAVLRYQPIGFRWAANLRPYAKASEPARFLGMFDEMAGGSSAILARAVTTVP